MSTSRSAAHHPAGVAGRVVGVAQRRSRGRQVEPELRAQPDRAGQLPGAAGDHHRQRAAEAAHQRQVGVLEHERADQLGAVLGRPRGVRRRGLVERARHRAGRSQRRRPDRAHASSSGTGTNLGDMAHYRAVGDVPPKRHTQHRDPDGKLYREELMGEEGFSSDSSLLYHRGRAVGDRRQRGLGAARPDADPQPPAQAAPPQAARARHRPCSGTDPVTGRRLVLGNNDVRIGYVVTGVDPSPYYRNAIGDECVYVEAGSGTVETVLGVLSYRTGDYVDRAARDHAPLGAVRAEPALRDRGQQPRRAAQALPVALRAAARARAVLRARPARPDRAVPAGRRGRRGAGQAPHQRRHRRAPG